MKKALVLIIVAAVVGLVISRTRNSDKGNAADGGAGPIGQALEANTAIAPRQAGVDASERLADLGDRVEPKSPSAPPRPVSEPPRSPSPEAEQPAAEPQVRPAEPAAEAPAEPAPASPDAVRAAAALIQRAVALEKEGELLKARGLLTRLYIQSGGQVRQAARAALDRMNKDLVFNPDCTDGAVAHEVQPGETLTHIARKHGVTWRCIARINGIDRPELVRVNRKLKILKGPRQMLIDKSEFLMALFVNGDFIKQYPIGHGKRNKTPTGDFVIDEMLIQPTWYPPEGGVIKYGEKGHLIGSRWLGFKDRPGATGLGIHGTSDPKSIGTMCSNGCIRMHDTDVIELYDLTTPGAGVTIVD